MLSLHQFVYQNPFDKSMPYKDDGSTSSNYLNAIILVKLDVIPT